jgi:uncharacterized heparinase superfamily protein
LTDDEPEANAASGAKLTRVAGDHGPSLGEQISGTLHRMSYRTVFHRLTMKGRQPLRLLGVPSDPVPGDASIGGALLTAGRLAHAGHIATVGDAWPEPAGAPEAWRVWANGFVWLRDLAAAAGRSEGSQVAELLVGAWLERHAGFDEATWAPHVAGLRFLFWTAYAPYILSSSDAGHRSAVLGHLAQTGRHLDKTADKAPEGLPRIAALAGLVASTLLLPGGERAQGKAEGRFARALDLFLLPDGGVASRAPLDMIELLELLLLAQASYGARAIRPTEAIAAGIARLVPALKGVLLGDGHLSAMHGSGLGDAARIERVIELSGIMARPLRNGTASGLQRMMGGKVAVVMDAGPPPLARVAAAAHAGTLAFEMSDGAQRLVVNCGGARGGLRPLPSELAELLRSTAAHSTLVLADSNSTRFRDDGALGKGVEEVLVHRHESEEGTWIETSHDGYVKRSGFEHQRRLYLSADGGDFRGEDALVVPGGKGKSKRGAGLRYDLRFHLGPGVEATPTADGQGALLKLPGGGVWNFKARGGALSLDESLWVDPDGRPRPTQQLVVSGDATPEGAAANWSFKRAR